MYYFVIKVHIGTIEHRESESVKSKTIDQYY